MDGLSLKADLIPSGSLYRVTANNAPPAHEHEAILEDKAGSIRLLGYDLSPDTVLPGEGISVTLHWQVIRPLAVDYTSYVHLVNATEQGVTQSNRLPGGVFYPSRYWQPGEILRDRHTLTIPSA